MELEESERWAHVPIKSRKKEMKLAASFEALHVPTGTEDSVLCFSVHRFPKY